MKHLYLPVLLIFFFIFFAKAQESEKRFGTSGNGLEGINFQSSIEFYKQMLSDDPNNADLNYKLGFCYLQSGNQTNKAISYFSKTIEILSDSGQTKSQAFFEARYNLAKACRITYQFDRAKEILDSLMKITTGEKEINLIYNELEICKNGLNLERDPLDINIFNIETINSSYDDHSPVISPDHLYMLFTSRREQTTGEGIDLDNQPFEDIYISYFPDGKWSEPENMGTRINSEQHESVCSISPDGTQMFIHRNGDIYVSTKIEGIWEKPGKAGKSINTKSRETHASVSADGRFLFFTSDRKEGYGGLDIYMAKKQRNGKWGDVVNLGPQVNTMADEETPFLHPDGITLFFSSKGHDNIGGFDIFYCTIQEDETWSPAINLGLPVNTTADDLFFNYSSDGLQAFYCCSKLDGTGKLDIYEAVFEGNKEILSDRLNKEIETTHIPASRMRYSADDIMSSEDFSAAIPLYKELLSENPDDYNVHYKIGYCYLKTETNQLNAIKHLTKAVDGMGKTKLHKGNLNKAMYYLALAYKLSYEFETARDLFKELAEQVNNEELTEKINRQIQLCENGIQIMKLPLQVTRTNLQTINSEYCDHSPVIAPDELMLIFTSRREGSTGGKVALDQQYYEDIYVSYNQDGNWTKPQNIGPNINTGGHEAACSLSPDGTRLYIYKDGDIFISKFENEEWSVPEKLGPPISTDATETHASVSPDGNFLFFTSDRAGGQGGLDIYYSKKLANGKWCDPRNLGPRINTKYNEETPFIFPDGITLFFSSQGLGTIGGYDVFYTTMQSDETWSDAVNLGYPVNTTGDDLFYMPTTSGLSAYYSSEQTTGSGYFDIYEISFENEEITTLSDNTSKSVIDRYEPSANYRSQEDFQAAIAVYNEQIAEQPDNPELYVKLGTAYMYSDMHKEKAVEYFKKAIRIYSEKDSTNPRLADAYFMMGKACLINYKMREAVDAYAKAMKNLSGERYKKVEREIEIAANATELMKMPVDISVKNLALVNSTYADYNPVISDNGNTLVFTSRREESTGSENITFGQYFEDIFISHKINGEWTLPTGISENINTEGNESACDLSADGKQLLIHREGDIYISYFTGSRWTVPVKLSEPVNSDANETHASFSPNGKTLYFVSDREGGLGGLDIYSATKLHDDKWGNIENLGKAVNTPYNEETPFMHNDGMTLFFSSQGHNTMGGYDVFLSTMQTDSISWSDAINIGYPVCTVEDDIFYMPETNGLTAYYASRRDDGAGLMDIYQLRFGNEDAITAEESEYKKHTTKDIIYQEDFKPAIKLYEEQLSGNPEDAEINYKLGLACLNTNTEKEKSIEYLEKAIKIMTRKSITKRTTGNISASRYSDKQLIDAYFFLGKAYHQNYMFKKALSVYDKIIPRTYEQEMLTKIKREIRITENAIEIMKHPVNISVSNLGSNINSQYSDHNPLVAADESVLIFTSRRKNIHTADLDYGQYPEDIYISHNKNGIWTLPENISDNINTTGDESACGISADGQTLLIQKNGDIYQSNLHGDKWSNPEKLEYPVNTDYDETHASLSADGKFLYFTSNREGGYGGLDIYICEKLPDGTWGEAYNLGPKINTVYNEETPFIHHDNKTLYFCSEGHKTMGGFDVFSSEKLEIEWSTPQNLGYPVNTPGNDIFFVPAADGKRAYYSSQKNDGIGQTDMYLILFNEKNETELTLVNGTIISENDMIPRNSRISIFDVETHDEIARYIPNSLTGKYLFVLTLDKTYRFLYEAPNYLPRFEDISIFEIHAFNKINKDIRLKPVKLGSTRQTYKIAFYDGDKDVNINNESELPLKILADFLAKHPQLYVDITSPKSDDKKTNAKRIESVKKFFKSNAVEEKRIYSGISNEKIQVDSILITIYDKQTFEKAAKSKGQDIAIAGNTNTADTDDISTNNDETNTISKENIRKVVIVENMIFEINKANTAKYNANLNKLASYLKENPDAKIEIGGHADTQGTKSYNEKLAQKRADFVKSYLLKKGVNQKQFSTKNYGISQQITINKNADGSYNWKSLKYNRRVEFQVLKPGKDKLVVEQIKVPERLKINKEEITETVKIKETTRTKSIENKQIVKESEITNNKQINKPEAEDLISYSILVRSSDTPVDIKTFSGLNEIEEHKNEDGSYIYYFGRFKSANEAEDALRKLDKSKYSKAMIFINEF